jgi:hypothetical protein
MLRTGRPANGAPRDIVIVAQLAKGFFRSEAFLVIRMQEACDKLDHPVRQSGC